MFDDSGVPRCERATALAERLGVPVVARNDALNHAFCLCVESTGLAIARGDALGSRARVDWRARIHPRRRSLGARRDPLLRAIGKAPRRVVDTTAGFGNDAFSLALAGHEVIAIERCPPIALLLEDALEAALADPELEPATSRMELRVGDAAKVLETLRALDRQIDCIYLDPMFPPKRKSSALAKLPLQILQELVGPDTDSEALFAAARGVARDRVVVKRPDHAAPLHPNPTVSYAGKLTRYDVYYRHAGGD